MKLRIVSLSLIIAAALSSTAVYVGTAAGSSEVQQETEDNRRTVTAAFDGHDYRNRYAWIFRMQDGKAVEAWAFLDLTSYDEVLRRLPAPEQPAMADHPYVGMWVTEDGNIRHELLPNGRYDEARGQRQSAYQGRYEVTGTHIEYWDDTGFTADGDFVDENTLHHGGMIFRRR